MAFKGLRFAGYEMKNMTASKAMIVVIIAIGIIPLLYGALYLYAFMDPYNNLDTVPVAVVNEDQGATISGEQRNVGDEVVDKLKENEGGLQWNFVSAAEADQGLENGSYYMTCTIPSDFSAKVGSADTDSPEKASLLVDYNESKNNLASQIGATVWKQVRQNISDSISTEYWTTTFDSVSDAGTGLQDAADAETTLGEGLGTAQNGSAAITANLQSLSSGASQLAQGLSTLAAGTVYIESGTGALASGTTSLAVGVASAESGSSSLEEAASRVTDGLDQLRNGTSTSTGLVDAVAAIGSDDDATSTTLIGGSNIIVAGLTSFEASVDSSLDRAIAGAGQIDAGLQQAVASIGADGDTAASGTLIGALNAALASEGQGLSDAGGAYATLAQLYAGGSGALTDAQKSQVANAMSDLSDVNPSASTPSSGVLYDLGAARQADGAALAGLKSLRTALGTLDAGATSLGQGLASGKTSVDQAIEQQLIPGVSALKSGLIHLRSGGTAPDGRASTGLQGALDALGSASSQGTLIYGSSAIEGGLGSLSQGLAAASEGAAQVSSGASQIDSGASGLQAGAASASSASQQVASGSAQLAAGSSTLTDGLTSAVQGASTIASALYSGAGSMIMDDGVITAKANMMSDPVDLDTAKYTSVKNYGSGFAPYFIGLGLWVGALVVSFAFRPLNNRLILSGGNPFMVAFTNFIPLAGIAIFQAVLLLACLQFGLQLQIDNVPMFYAFGILVSLAFAALMQFLIAAFAFPGRFLAIIFLMLQLTSAAGTFPIEMTPGFFQAISPYMPMTYAVEGLRQIMTGLDMGVAGHDAVILLAIGGVSFLLTVLVARSKRMVKITDLHPIVHLG